MNFRGGGFLELSLDNSFLYSVSVSVSVSGGVAATLHGRCMAVALLEAFVFARCFFERSVLLSLLNWRLFQLIILPFSSQNPFAKNNCNVACNVASSMRNANATSSGDSFSSSPPHSRQKSITSLRCMASGIDCTFGSVANSEYILNH